jgi:excinuclease UvrABC nuclease subunit
VLTELESACWRMPRRLEFEQAAELRNQMSACPSVLHQQSMEIAATRTSTSWP